MKQQTIFHSVFGAMAVVVVLMLISTVPALLSGRVSSSDLISFVVSILLAIGLVQLYRGSNTARQLLLAYWWLTVIISTGLILFLLFIVATGEDPISSYLSAEVLIWSIVAVISIMVFICFPLWGLGFSTQFRAELDERAAAQRKFDDARSREFKHSMGEDKEWREGFGPGSEKES